MTAADVLSWSGLGLTLVGTAIAALGIGETWRQFRPEGARFWGSFYSWADRRLRQPARSLRVAAQRRWNSLRGATDVRQVSGAASAVLSFTATASGVVTYGPLPDPGDDGAFAEEVQRRTNELRMGIQRMESSLSAETAVREKAIGKLQRQLDDQHDRLRDMTQQVAISGLPLEMTGIFFCHLRNRLAGNRSDDQVVQLVRAGDDGERQACHDQCVTTLRALLVRWTGWTRVRPCRRI